jgi:hypothetical protein
MPWHDLSITAVVTAASKDGVKRHKKSRLIERQRYVCAISVKPTPPIFIRFLYRGFGRPLEFICLAPLNSNVAQGASKMLDVIMLALGFAFFALSIGYVYACDRL